MAIAILVANAPVIYAATATLAWDPNPDPSIAGYRLSYGTQSRVYTTVVDVGNVTTKVVTVTSGVRYYFVVQAYITSGMISAYSNEVIFDAAAPTITRLSSLSGPVGTAITITGTNFGTSGGSSSTVTFNGVAAMPTIWSAASITVAVPPDATTGNVVVTVNGVASAGVPFTVLPTGTLVHDSFTAVDGTNGNLRLPDVSIAAAPWRLWGGPGIEVRGNQLRTMAGPDWEAATVDAGAADAVVTTDVMVSTLASPYGGVIMRLTNADNYILARFYGSNLILYRRQNGQFIPLGTVAITAAAGTTHRLGLSAVGTALTVTWDGTAMLSTTESFNQTATQHGVSWAPFVDALTAYDNFDVVLGTPPPNHAPLLTAPANQNSVIGATGSLQLVASDPDANTLTYGATGLPGGLTVNGATGQIIGTTTAPGTFTVTVSVSDGSLSDSKTFTWTVTSTPPSGTMLVHDSFTAVDGTNGNLRLPDVSIAAAPWRLWGGPGIEVRGNRLRTMEGSDWEAATVDAGAADAVVTADVTVSTLASPYGGIIMRLTNADNYILARFYGSNLVLYRRQNGQFIPLGTVAITAAAGTTHRLGLSAVGTALTVTWDGTVMLSTTEAFNQTATQHGLSWAPFVDALTAYDNFDVVDGTPPPSMPSHATLVQDSFTAVDGTNANLRLPDVSIAAAPWRLWGGLGIEVRGNQLRTMAGPDWEAAAVDAGAADAVVTTDVTVSTMASPYGGVIMRLTNADNYILARFYGSNLALYRRQNGQFIALGNVAITAAAGTTHQLGLSAVGTALIVTWDGMAMLSKTEAFNQTATQHGVSWAPFVDAFTAYDNFSVTTP